MKTSQMVKILSVLLVIAMIMMVMTTSVFALEPSGVTPSTTNADSSIQDFGGKILSAVTTAGIVLSVIVLAVLGIKYMLGSAEEKAEYKKTLMPYLVGAILIFGASTIAQIVYQFMQ